MRAALRAERLALAVLSGEISSAEAREDLSLALRQAETERNASALRAYRAGGSVWAWPTAAPWAGF